jgi:hypothetical protein
MRHAPSEASGGFDFPQVAPEHVHMQRLLANAMGFANPSNGLIDAASGYPVEGWNHEPERGLYLRSFTQLTAIGEWLELLANVAAGQADSPHLSRGEALRQMEQTVTSLLADQADPAISHKGLLVNFLGLESAGRVGPLSEEVEKRRFVEEFGEEPAGRIWSALAARGWILPQQDGSFAKVSRQGEYGERFFTGELASFSTPAVRAKIMAILDERVVQIIFGDNANLTASAAKAIGALRHSSLKDDPQAVLLCERLERFIERQQEGYRFLYDPATGTFFFGWNATQRRFTGWQDGEGRWITGRMNYLVNEFRGPLLFVVQRFELPDEAVKNCGVTLKPYRTADGRDLYTLATWHGSAFQLLGLSLFMQELEQPGWRETLENGVAAYLDYSDRHRLPGFLSESYSGRDTQYTGDIGLPDLAVTDHPRLTDAPSLYTLGTAYSISPEAVEALLAKHWKTIRLLFTDHGPWEGFNTTQNEPIRFQTSAHTLALIVGGIGTAGENMQRYLTWRGVTSLSRVTGEGRPGDAVDFLGGGTQWIGWSPVGDSIEVLHWRAGGRIRGEAVRQGAVTIKTLQPVSLSNGALLLRYRAATPLTNAVLTLSGGPLEFENRIHLRLDATETEREIRIPLPGTPGLEQIGEQVLRFGDPQRPLPVDVTISGWEFLPAP